MPHTLEFAVAGAGIAGLASAIALARGGHTVTVFEQARVIDEVGAGLQIGPNAVHALQQLGVWQTLQPVTVAPDRIVIRNGQSARALSQIQLTGDFENRFGAPYRVAHRADLISSLHEAARNQSCVQIRTDCTVEGFDTTANGVTLCLADGLTHSADALIAADGIHSQIRRTLLDDGPPDYAGHAIYRALLPMIDVPKSTNTTSVNLWLCPGGHVVHYPVNAGRQLNIVAAADSLWVEDGWHAAAERSEVTRLFAGAATPLAELLQAPAGWHKWAGADRRPAAHWSKGPVTLIGDAAHPALPYLAQGAAMALEDAVVLGQFCINTRNIADALVQFAVARQARTARVANTSRNLGRTYHLRSLPAVARNFTLSALTPTFNMSRLSWLYSWKPTGLTT